jgi:hypothetical protein
MSTSYLTDEMRAAIGAVVDWRVSFPVSASDIRRWAIAVYFPDPPPARYWNAAATAGGIVAPEEFNPFAWLAAEEMTPKVAPLFRDTDRLEKAIGITGPGLLHQLNGGSEVSYGVPMRPGDVVRSETRLHEYRERAGRLGTMLMTVTEVEWTNQRSERVLLGHNTSIRYGSAAS